MKAASALARALCAAALIALTMMMSGPAAATQAEESASGTISDNDGEPVSGVTVTASQDGEQVGNATSDDQGQWQIGLPGPGTYELEVDLGTVPENLVPRQAGGEVLTDVDVSGGQNRTVLFPLVPEGQQQDAPAETEPPAPEGDEPADQDQKGQADPADPADPGDPGGADPADPGAGGGGDEPTTQPPPEGAPFLERLAQVLLNGIQYGGVIAICAVGLSLVFGTTRLINFAHGELVTIGAVVAFFFNVTGPGFHLIVATALAVVAGALAGGGLERGLWRPLRARGTGRINLFIISIGLALLLRHVILVLHGSRPVSYADYNIQNAISLGPVAATPRDLSILGLSIIVLFGVALMLQRTRIGTAIRAVSDNRDLAESSGINVNRVVLVVWMLGGALAAFGGVMFGLTEVVSWDMGFRLLLLMFAGIILGGLGSAYGAMVGSFLVGIVAHLSTLWFPAELQNFWALLVLIIVLIVRPQGILGRKERIG